MTINAKAMYTMHFIGVKIPSIFPIRLIPPQMIRAITTAVTITVMNLSAPKPC